MKELAKWRALLCVSVSLALAACGGSMTPEEKAAREKREWAQALADAQSPEAMWYHYTFEGDYQGEPVKLDQMVYCPIRSFSGGSFGQSTPYSIRAQHPMTIAQKMDDGSQVLVRIPDVCQRYRAYKEGEGFQQGWEAQQTIDAMPYVIWSDAYPKASRIEGYVSPAYYDHPDARLQIVSSQIDLLPVGSHPDDFEDVLRQEHAIPYAPNPWIRGQDRDGGWMNRGGGYYDADNQFISLYQIPIINMNSYAKQFKVSRPDLKGGYIFDEEKGFSDPNIAAYNEASSMAAGDGSDPDNITHDCVISEFEEILGGRPLSTSVPYDRPSPGGIVTPSTEENWHTRKQRETNCRSRLAQLQSFEIVDGRFDASRSIPGVAVYHRWGQPGGDWRNPDKERQLKLQTAGLVTSDGYKMAIDGYRFSFPIKEYGDTISTVALFENKKSEQWYLVRMSKFIFKGKGENNHF